MTTCPLECRPHRTCRTLLSENFRLSTCHRRQRLQVRQVIFYRLPNHKRRALLVSAIRPKCAPHRSRVISRRLTRFMGLILPDNTFPAT